MFNIGLDVGSTTVKLIVLNDEDHIVFKAYRRHFSDIKNTVITLFEEVKDLLSMSHLRIAVTGSAGLSLAESLGIPFVQEVIACTKAIKKYAPETDVAIELGGEDAKIMYFGNSVEQRMNGTCAGGTGAFIDQMSVLLRTDADGLNDLATNHRQIYPIASRCGVFAKTDIQPLLNEGASKEDIAASVLQAVVNQTISGLACGKPIRGKIAFIGGPLSFLPELKNRFRETLKLDSQNEIVLEDTQYFVAIGAALTSKLETSIETKCIYDRVPSIYCESKEANQYLNPLFATHSDYNSFLNRHQKIQSEKADLSNVDGPIFVGIDAGSTTTKVIAIDENNRIVFSNYGSNEGDPLFTTIRALMELYNKMPSKAYIAHTAVTGYGELLLKAALGIDCGEIETVAHYRAAAHFVPNVDFILDIGGQDMKCLKVKNGIIDTIMLNEACSSGCGSFIETFATALNHDVKSFSEIGLMASKPVDLGTRCTVFMNSKVKQAQKEGASVGDISAGIAISVIKNALFKVIRMKNASDLGNNIVVQGGTFNNNAVLRAFESISGKNVTRPDIAGLMGAFGSAILAKERYNPQSGTKLLTYEALKDFKVSYTSKRCELCVNHCQMTVNTFSDDNSYTTGNRCERGAGIEHSNHNTPNLYAYKYKRVFEYPVLPKSKAVRGTIGIPRVLNIYEDYPFWAAFFTALDYSVVLSARSSKMIYEMGMETIPSESVCYPAKLVHGHIEDLINKKVDRIFYPCIPYNIIENKDSDNHYNCPVVTSYPETISANIDNLISTAYSHPFLPIHDVRSMKEKLVSLLKEWGVPKSEVLEAVEIGYSALEKYKSDVRQQGENTIEKLKTTGQKGIVLSGRPYHIDPEINHGIPELIRSYGFAVLSEDSIAHLATIDRPLKVVDQWMYHSRLYAAATFVTQNSNLEMIQLNSFGCGLDAVTSDQVKSIMESQNRLNTLIKIDEINNLGAVRIRIRSLMAAMEQRTKQSQNVIKEINVNPYPVFTVEMKKTHTLLVPQMSPIHFQFLESAAKPFGLNLEVLPSIDLNAIDEGLKYVNNDACYPSILVVGQMMKAINSGKYDLNKTALIISQTGGGCRATNYISFIRQALEATGNSHIPVISLNALGLEKHPGFKLSKSLLERLLQGMLYGDLLMRTLYKIRPYEEVKGSANGLYESWVKRCNQALDKGDRKTFISNIYNIVSDFDELAISNIIKPKVGLVGEILVKFHPTANNNIVELLEKEGAEAVMPDLMDFFAYAAYNGIIKHQTLTKSYKSKWGSEAFIALFNYYRKPMVDALNKSKRFEAPKSIYTLADLAKPYLSLCNQTGEGWFLTAEMLELIHSGVNNIVCMQPFACLPNHITGKGMIKKLRASHPTANITAIDYDPGASEVNQINRIKLMLASAFDNLQ